MKRLTCFIMSFIVWILLTWPFGEEGVDLQVVIAGLVASVGIALLFHEVFPSEHQALLSPVRLFWALIYMPVFFYYMIIANLDVVYRALHPKMPIHPGIVKVKTELKTDSAITALANSITLTPGTLTVDLDDNGVLYVHWINVKSPDVEESTKMIVGKFEWFLKKIFE